MPGNAEWADWDRAIMQYDIRRLCDPAADMGVFRSTIVLQFGGRIGSTTGEVPLNFYSNSIILTSSPSFETLREITRYNGS